MKSCGIVILGLVLLIVLVGCSATFSNNRTGEIGSKPNEKSETYMGSHHVTVKPPSTITDSSSSSFLGGNKTYEYSCGDVSITIRNEELIVNNRKYGRLRDGCSILVDNGKVTVTAQKDQGTSMFDKLIMLSTTESRDTIAGYSVTVRPGSSSISKIDMLGKHAFTVGKTKVSIKKDRLFVNKTPYGRLKQGDSILIENSKVFVAGEPREPTK